MEEEHRETIFNLVQNFLKNPPLIVWGSGATISFGLPSMWHLNEVLKKEIDNFDDTNENLEAELSKDKYQEQMPQIKKIIWNTIHQPDITVLEKIITKNSDFDGIKSLIEKLIDTHPKVANIVTTNYDRVLEYVMSYHDILYTDGFNGQMLSMFKEQQFKDKELVNLVKVHGSLNWFNVDGETRYLNCFHEDKTPQIITPSKNKYQEAYQSPYRELIQKSDNLIENATSFLVIGFGFNDEHLTPKIKTKVKKGIPIILLTKEVTSNSYEELKDAEKYLFFEESKNDGMTKITYKENSSSDIKEIELEGAFWQLNKFMEIF